MTSKSDSSGPSSPSTLSSTGSDPDFVVNSTGTIPQPTQRETRAQTKAKTDAILAHNKGGSLENLIDLSTWETREMAQLSLETAIKLVPKFDGKKPQEVYPFLKAGDFVMENVNELIRPILLQAILTKLSDRAFAVTQHREISSWAVLKGFLEENFCAQRTPGYLQLELSTTRFRQGETVNDYSSRVEKLLHELCNVSTKRKTPEEARTIHEYIKEVTLTSYIEGLPTSIRGLMKSRNPHSIEEAIKESLEEEKIYQSNKGTLRLLQGNPSTSGTSKYCKNCRKTNHNTDDCRYSSRNVDGEQQIQQSRGSSSPKYTGSCSYCRKTGHRKEDCFKKKNAESRKMNNDGQTNAGNDKRTDAAGDRPVRELKVIAQHQKS